MSRARPASPSRGDALSLTPAAEIARLALKPGDALVVTLDRSIATAEIADHLRDYLAPIVPSGVRLVIVDDRVGFSVVEASPTI